MKRRWASAATGVLLCAITGLAPAWADGAPAGQWIGNAGVVSDSQTDRKPAVQAGVEFDHASGWYIGGWGSNVSWLSDASTSAAPTSSSVENVPGASYSDWKLGVTRNFAGGWSAALGYCDTHADASVHTNAQGHYLGRATAVLNLARSF